MTVIEALGAVARTARKSGLGPVVHRLSDALDALFLGLRRPPLGVDVDGLRLRGFLRHRSFLAEAVRPEATYRELFAGLLEPGQTVVDAGAHVGLYSLLAARGGAEVFAFEPDSYNLAALVFNASRSQGVIRIAAKALGERRRRATFYRSRATIGSSLLRRAPSDVETTVEVTSLDEELRGVDVGSLLVKLNIEGAELLALEGMRETLERCRDVTLLVEVNPQVLDRPHELVSRLVGLGFEVSWIDLSTQSLVPLDLSGPLGKGHLLGVRRDR